MIMSAETARHFFGDGDPLGRTLSLPVFKDGATQNADMTLVGVIAEVKYSGLERPRRQRDLPTRMRSSRGRTSF